MRYVDSRGGGRGGLLQTQKHMLSIWDGISHVADLTIWDHGETPPAKGPECSTHSRGPAGYVAGAPSVPGSLGTVTPTALGPPLTGSRCCPHPEVPFASRGWGRGGSRDTG